MKKKCKPCKNNIETETLDQIYDDRPSITYEKMFNTNTWEEFLNKIIKYDFNAAKLGFTLPYHLQDN